MSLCLFDFRATMATKHCFHGSKLGEKMWPMDTTVQAKHGAWVRRRAFYAPVHSLREKLNTKKLNKKRWGGGGVSGGGEEKAFTLDGKYVIRSCCCWDFYLLLVFPSSDPPIKNTSGAQPKAEAMASFRRSPCRRSSAIAHIPQPSSCAPRSLSRSCFPSRFVGERKVF